MDELFTALTKAVEGAPAVALGAALLWGVLSIVLSPCHLASIPLIIGFISGQREITARRAFRMALLFALGILVTIAIIGAVTAALGRMAGDLGGWVNYTVAVVFLVMGLHLLGVIPLPLSAPGQVNMTRKGLLAAFLLGLIFGIALGPCTFAFMAPVLGITLTVARSAPVYAAGLLLLYGVGHCAVIVAAGASTEMASRYLHWTESSHGMPVVKQVCGGLVLCGGLYLLYTAR